MIRVLLIALGVCLAGNARAAGAHDGSEEHRILLVGDILLARQVAREIDARGISPWRDIGDALKRADFVFGNFEGTVGNAEDCEPPKDLCFAVKPQLVPLARQAGFTALGTANNHSGDLGAAGRLATRETLEAAGLAAVGSDQSPAFFRLGSHTVGLVNLSLVPGRDRIVDTVPSWQVARTMRLARALADWVVVSVHWGKELADWVSPEQEAQAGWLQAQGADVIVGSHPHVVQPAACLDGRPVFYSLGNHVFDQKYPITKQGLIGSCKAVGDVLTCSGVNTETSLNSSFPRISATPYAANAALSQCPVPARRKLTVAGQTITPWIRSGKVASGKFVLEGISANGRWRSAPGALLGIDSGQLVADRPPMLFTLERHLSPIDNEDGPRPYVYDVTPHGLVARWRGSALAWPLIDAMLMTDPAGRAHLCALHRGDSFVMLDDTHPEPPRIQVYAWNGFGFSGETDEDLTIRCARQFGLRQD